MMTRHRLTISYMAFVLHRLSGIGLICFLPFHFLVLGLGLEGEAALDNMLAYTDQPLIKLGEYILVILFSLHLLLGIRVLIIEWMPWPDRADGQGGLRAGWIFAALGIALILGWIFIDGVIA
ncbi:MAG: succinate dehydrogenase [Alphaproteobacteria bacterium]|nr:succinate dehydrogenase [Alphaproteobacteria bacterium]